MYTTRMHEERCRPAPILIGDRFLAARQLLLQLLESLSPSDWGQPTAAPLWSVKDVALHLLGGDIGNLSRRRDRFQEPGKPITGYRELVAFINGLNEDWVRAARRMSPRLLCDLLAFTGPQLADYFAGLDLFALGGPVNWAGPERAPV
ncbi:MAG TPA: maleylpyruvate isomerase N-terminal domain-containing protein, partial [Acidobacteriaceae bacterium]|nr:maleylpyruvate isomerase N-terminal domain-containing protein [Acidobacteriaceae bacterium]